MSTVVSYPGVMPAATQVALAFHEAGRLARYETTLAYGSQSLLERALRGASELGLMRRARSQLERLALPELPHSVISTRPYLDVLRRASERIGLDAAYADRLWELCMLDFDRHVAASLGEPDRAGALPDSVYGYEHGCRYSFERARELGMRRIRDMASPHHSFIAALFERELQAHPELETPHWRATRPLEAARNAHKQAEYALADLVIANSSFTARTLTSTGFPSERVAIVPLAAPPVDATWRTLDEPSLPVRFLFAGTASVRKGAPQLLEAFRRLNAGRAATLDLAGAWTLPSEQRAQLPPNATHLGNLPRAELYRRFVHSSVLVFPSLCDGFGLVVTEALAHGLPVITTHDVGASDLITSGKNGWVIAPGDVDALVDRMQHCLDHPNELHAMREAAEQTAREHPWSDYRRRLLAAIDRALL